MCIRDRYKSKAFIDAAVYRGGDLFSGWIYYGLGTFIGLSLGTIALIAAPVMAVWAIVAIGIGARGDAMAVSDGDDLGDAVSVG